MAYSGKLATSVITATVTSLDKKLYTVNEKVYTVSNNAQAAKCLLQMQIRYLTILTIIIITTIELKKYKIYMGRVGFEPTTPAMSRRYLNQARPPALLLLLGLLCFPSVLI